MSQLLNIQPGDYFKLLAGLVGFGINEINLRTTVDDPAKYTVEGSLFPNGSTALGAWSARLVLPGDRVVELVLIQFKKDERTRDRNDVHYGEWTIHVKGPETPQNPDGMVLVFLALHDYVWIKGVSQETYPQPPALALPDPPQEPEDDWTSNHMKHVQEIGRIEQELGMPMDSDRVNAYLTGRNRNLAEVHDDELVRSGLEGDPCGGANRIPLP